MLPRSRSAVLVAALVLGWGILGVVDAAAAPPRNDDFRNARVIGALPFEHRIDTREATTKPRDPKCVQRKRSVWYSFTASEEGWLLAETAGSNYDTTLAVVTGTGQNRRRIGCDDDSGLEQDLTSMVLFEATAGETYHFMVGSFNRRSGRLVFALSSSEAPCFGAPPSIVGTPGDDLIQGTPGFDIIVGLEGNDTIEADGFDVVCGNEGNDTIRGATQAGGNDGDDILTASLQNSSSLSGGDGNDTLIGGFGDDVLVGRLGDDVMRGNEGFDALRDSQGENQFYGGPNSDHVLPGRGTGVVVGGGGHDTLSYSDLEIDGIVVDMGAGTVLVEGAFAQTTDGIESVTGSGGPDTFMGSNGEDEFFGGGGDDTIVGLPGDDELNGGVGADTASGSEGDDHLSGGPGIDMLDGGEGNDGLNGGGDSDSCLNGERIINCE